MCRLCVDCVLIVCADCVCAYPSVYWVLATLSIRYGFLEKMSSSASLHLLVCMGYLQHVSGG